MISCQSIWMSGKYVKIYGENELIVKIFKAKKVQHARTPKRIENSMILHTKKICSEATKETPKTETSMSWPHLLKCSQARTTLTT